MESIYYKDLEKAEININLFKNFNRYQDVRKCWRKENGKWILKDIAFIEQWGLEEFEYLIKCLQNTIKTGGKVFGAFDNNALVAFASVENEFFGSHYEYLQLSCIHTSYESRGKGIGKKMFSIMSKIAKDMGAKKLYISAHSSEESQSFYKKIGCVEALQYNAKLQDAEPYDCQLEFSLEEL